MPYQTFDETKPGDSDSAGKLARLGLAALTIEGADCLDIGCNGGFFCQALSEMGAAVVYGMDTNADVIAEAEKLKTRGRVRFFAEDWNRLVGTQWDIVLLLSAIHYERDQVGLLRRIRNQLAPGGTLVLECGVAPAAGDTWQRVTRCKNSTVRYPSMSLLQSMLDEAGLTFRYIGPSVDQKGDPTPRHVFHCRRKAPQLLLVSGGGRAGKSTLCRDLGAVCFSVDEFTRQTSSTERAPWVERLESLDTDRLLPFYQLLSDEPDTMGSFIDSLFDCLPDAGTVVVDCHELLTPAVNATATENGFKVWTATTGGANG